MATRLLLAVESCGGRPRTMASMPKTGMERMMVSCRRLSFNASKWSEYTVEVPLRARW